MAPFKKVKILQSIPSISTNSSEINAVPLSLQDSTAPNYDAKIELVLNTTYTIGVGPLATYIKGYLLAGCTTRADDNNPSINVNGVSSLLMGNDGDIGWDQSGYCVFIPLKTGDYFNVGGVGTDARGTERVWFVPTKE